MPDFAAALAALYTEHAEPFTLGAVEYRCIPDTGFVDAGGLSVAGTAPSFRIIAAEVPAIARNSTVVRVGVTYRVRSLEPLAPDALETRVILERQ